MKLFLYITLFCISSSIAAQSPPIIQWQKSFGGSLNDYAHTIRPTTDGGYIIAGETSSADGDITLSHGNTDIWLVKINAAGIIQWQQTYGGRLKDFAEDILPTPDGGYIFSGTTYSNDADVSGNHGESDCWVVKINATGSIQWSRCYGGSLSEQANHILIASDGGYIIAGSAASGDGDVTGIHSVGFNDSWIIKLDLAGNIQWQTTIGGTADDGLNAIAYTSDGGYILTGNTISADGNAGCRLNNNSFEMIVVKISATGVIEWHRCFGGAYYDNGIDVIQTADGGFMAVGETLSSDLPGFHGSTGFDAIVLKLDASGVLQWQKLFGGSKDEAAVSVFQSADGNYIIGGSSSSNNGDLCSNNGKHDIWVLQLSAAGNIIWQKNYGGSSFEFLNDIIPTTDAGFIVAGHSVSDDLDVSGNHGENDWWIVKLEFPPPGAGPQVNISADQTVVCMGTLVTFTATVTNGGLSPFFQWKLNGVNTGPDNDTVSIAILHDGDQVSCEVTSSDPCLGTMTGFPDFIRISIDPALGPKGFLPAETEICSNGTALLTASGSYLTYLWSTNATTPTITISQPGTYWLQVTDNTHCMGRDSVIVIPKNCFNGFYMPTAFTPNRDGKNDFFKPIVGGVLTQYKLQVYNAYGEIIFTTTDPEKGWNGSFRNISQTTGVFIWQCFYQFSGGKPAYEKGTVILIR